MTDNTEADDAGMLGFNDAFEIASKVVEMADRVKRTNPAVPGISASWVLEIDDTRFKVVVTLDDAKP